MIDESLSFRVNVTVTETNSGKTASAEHEWVDDIHTAEHVDSWFKASELWLARSAATGIAQRCVTVPEIDQGPQDERRRLVGALYDAMRACEEAFGLDAGEFRSVGIGYLHRPDGSRQMEVRFPGHVTYLVAKREPAIGKH